MPDTVLDGTAVKEVASLAKQAAAVQQFTYGDRAFTDHPLHRVDVDPEQPRPFQTRTLEGLIDFLKTEPAAKDAIVHVLSPALVEAVSPLFGADTHLRNTYAKAECPCGGLLGFAFNVFASLETLHVALQTCFELDRGDVEELRKFCASIRSTEEIGVSDDGVSQEVNAKAGIAAVVTTVVKNPWELAPWRTFPEVAQPVSPYVLRFRRNAETPQAGLFETGNAAWYVVAVHAIANHLRANLGATWTVLG